MKQHRDHRHEHHRDRHRQVAAQTGPDLAEDELQAHGYLPSRGGRSAVGRRRRYVGPAVSGRSRRRRGLSSRTISPSLSSTTRLRIWSTMSSSWVAMTMVVPVAVDPVEQPHDVEADRGVEVAGGLVAEQDRRLVDERAGDRHALLLTAGQLVRQPLLLAVRGRPSRASRARSAGSAWRERADHLQGEGDVLVDGLVRQQPEVLEDGADLAAQRAAPCGRAGRPSSRPATRTWPPVARSSRRTRRSRVDLPEPDGPTTKTNSPRSTSRLTFAQRGTARPGIDLGDVLEADHAAGGLCRLGDRAGPRCATAYAAYGRGMRSSARTHERTTAAAPAVVAADYAVRRPGRLRSACADVGRLSPRARRCASSGCRPR